VPDATTPPLLEVTGSDGVVSVRLNRPADRNALNRALMQELTDFARAHRTRPDVRAIVLSGASYLLWVV
jgi:enoyl-CoA hydratase